MDLLVMRSHSLQEMAIETKEMYSGGPVEGSAACTDDKTLVFLCSVNKNKRKYLSHSVNIKNTFSIKCMSKNNSKKKFFYKKAAYKKGFQLKRIVSKHTFKVIPLLRKFCHLKS